MIEETQDESNVHSVNTYILFMYFTDFNQFILMTNVCLFHHVNVHWDKTILFEIKHYFCRIDLIFFSIFLFSENTLNGYTLKNFDSYHHQLHLSGTEAMDFVGCTCKGGQP